MSMRDEFEATYSRVFPGQKLDRDANGGYVNVAASAAWRVYQSAQAPASGEVDPVAELFIDEEGEERVQWLTGRDLPDGTLFYTHQPAKVPEAIKTLMRVHDWWTYGDGDMPTSLEQEIEATITQPAATPAKVPEGWKLVPIESTSEMDLAAEDADLDKPIDRDHAEAIWSAMIAVSPASPTPPTAQEGE